MATVTGESHEQRKANDDLVYSGSVVRGGEAPAGGRTTELVQSTHPSSAWKKSWVSVR